MKSCWLSVSRSGDSPVALRTATNLPERRARANGCSWAGRARLARWRPFWSTPGVALPHIISTLLYCFDARDRMLLWSELRNPTCGFWSPCGGKLKTDIGESPYACACREATEELGLELRPADLHLTGLVSEHGYQGQTHWLMFLFEVKRRYHPSRPAREGGSASSPAPKWNP